jgi:cardiolipin synthase
MAFVLHFDPHNVWHWSALAFSFGLALFACGHAVLYKRETQSAIAWVGFICLVPLIGSVLYFVFGVNRLRRRAALLRGGLARYRSDSFHPECPPDDLGQHVPNAGHLNVLARVVGVIVGRPLLPGNEIEPLVNGDEAFPAMLDAIRAARKSIALQTYIFDRDEAGIAFAEALGEAVRRGVEVRVLIDAAGIRYSWPTILKSLRQQGVKHARFLPSLAPWSVTTLNMRTHRKLLVIDGGVVGFTGGMNIRIGNCLKKHPHSPVQDLHFRVRGPVVAQFQEAFTDDWLFTTREALRGDAWFPKLEPAGQMLARGITDGPDEDFEKLRWTLLGALAVARRSVRIMTPYFLPDSAIVSSLNLAAMRGVDVEILLPSQNNLPVVQWASRAMWWQVLERGCRLWLTAPPFDHSKLMIVDDAWVLVGSANWDARSLRLNFEYNLESYDATLAARLGKLMDQKRVGAHEVTLGEIDKRGLIVRLGDGVARLASPYL